MATPYEVLSSFISQQEGITQAEAEHAIRKCVMSMGAQGAVSYAAGGAIIIYFMNSNPSTAFGYGTLAFGAGAAHALNSSPQCTDVRKAIAFWNRL